jgi:hypothetical protein
MQRDLSMVLNYINVAGSTKILCCFTGCFTGPPEVEKS